jgi:cytochrome c-type biogenesis protein CcmF
MLAYFGSILVGLALAAALYAAFTVYWSIHRSNPRWAEHGRNAVYLAAAFLAMALWVLLMAFLGNQFQFRYVAQHSGRALPLYLKASALWAGQEGSLLLWAFLQAVFAALVVSRPAERASSLTPWATVFLSLITAFFAAMTLFLSNPFAQSAALPADGQGLNPLLRHPGMIFHPPVLYLGYVGLAVPFAFALAALFTRHVEDWPAAARRWTLAAWLFLGLGLLLGARWAYDVLSWGGYWGWDPVENAGLMPWLTATALLHGLTMQEQRGGFRVWNLLLAVFSFVLVLFGTFTTRSGLIQSVHAFAPSSLGSYFLALIGVTLVGSLILLYSRRSVLANPHPPERLLSREGAFLLTLILFLTITASVLVGSVLPTLTDVLTGRRFEAGSAWFDRVTGPQFAALLLLLGFCPLLGSAADTLRRLRKRRWLIILLGAVLVTAAAALAGFTRPISLLGFAIVGLAGATALLETAQEIVLRSVRKDESLLRALWHVVGHNRRRYGGYLVHIGVILMAAGIIGTRLYPFETEVTLFPGKPVDVKGYTLVYEELRQETAGDHLSTWASVAVYQNGAYLTTLLPRLNQYPDSDQTVTVPALRTGLREDLYLVLFWWSEDGSASIKVIVNPLVNLLWLGGLIFLAGGTVAFWQPARVADLPASARRWQRAGTIAGIVAGLLLFIAAGLAMWGPGHGAVTHPTGRPLPGQAAPDFALDLLDGTTLTLADMRGKVAVINFWATWCLSCERELPDLQTLWEAYQGQGVVVVGVAFQDEEAEVQEMAARLGITYPLGLEPAGRISRAYGITAVPETFVIDAQGQVACVHIGPVNAEELAAELDQLVGK